MLLAIDIGNTKIKAAVFEGHTLIEKLVFDKESVKQHLGEKYNGYPEIDTIVLASVNNEDVTFINWLHSLGKVIIINHKSHLPFNNQYGTPHTLGTDRLVLSAGAVLQYPERNRLVIDAGTCVTYDFTDNSNDYLGGAISPGIKLRYKSMHNFTAKLPLLYAEMPKDYIGNTTAESIHSGVVNGIIYEIEGFIKSYEERYSNLEIILTGGDAEFLAKRLKSTIFANSNFLLESLNALYLYTIQIEND